jgi:hypothetical protein
MERPIIAMPTLPGPALASPPSKIRAVLSHEDDDAIDPTQTFNCEAC